MFAFGDPVLLLPVSDNNAAAVERDNEPLDDQQFQTVHGEMIHVTDAPWIFDEAVIIGIDNEHHIQKFGIGRHFRVGVSVYDLNAQHSSFSHPASPPAQ
jgi:hypothetical protein